VIFDRALYPVMICGRIRGQPLPRIDDGLSTNGSISLGCALVAGENAFPIRRLEDRFADFRGR
jgi:hypothetical protein